MKKVILLLVAVFALTACSKEEKKEEKSVSIIGTWKPYKSETGGKEDKISECEKSNGAFIFCLITKLYKKEEKKIKLEVVNLIKRRCIIP